MRSDYADSSVTRNREIKKKMPPERANNRLLETSESVTMTTRRAKNYKNLLERFEKY